MYKYSLTQLGKRIQHKRTILYLFYYSISYIFHQLHTFIVMFLHFVSARLLFSMRLDIF